MHRELYGAINQGYIPTIAGGPWTHMRVDVDFGLSGGGDIFTLNGATVLIPRAGYCNLKFVGDLPIGFVPASLGKVTTAFPDVSSTLPISAGVGG